MKIFKTLLSNYSSTNYITGLRAFSVLGVILIHVGGAGLRNFGSIGNAIVDFGSQGVTAFFVISGFSIAHSLMAVSYGRYLKKRLVRIVPLYYFWLLIAVLQMGKLDIYLWFNLLAHLSFLSFVDYKIANSILHLEWSIPIEIFWYLFIPAMVLLCTKKWLWILMPLLAFFFYIELYKYVGRLPFDNGWRYIALLYSPIPHVLPFTLGVTAYKIKQLYKFNSVFGDVTVLLVCVFLYMLFSGKINNSLLQSEYIAACIITFCLIVFGSDKSLLYKICFNSYPMILIGTASYGIYLCHLQVLDHIGLFEFIGSMKSKLTIFITVTLFSIFVSLLLMMLIERPAKKYFNC